MSMDETGRQSPREVLESYRNTSPDFIRDTIQEIGATLTEQERINLLEYQVAHISFSLHSILQKLEKDVFLH